MTFRADDEGTATLWMEHITLCLDATVPADTFTVTFTSKPIGLTFAAAEEHYVNDEWVQSTVLVIE